MESDKYTQDAVEAAQALLSTTMPFIRIGSTVLSIATMTGIQRVADLDGDETHAFIAGSGNPVVFTGAAGDAFWAWAIDERRCLPIC